MINQLKHLENINSTTVNYNNLVLQFHLNFHYNHFY